MYKVIELAKSALTRPTPPADAMPTDEERRQVLKWVNFMLNVQNTVELSEHDTKILNSINRLLPAPVTDAQREALEAFDLYLKTTKDDTLLGHEGTIRAALSAPVAQVDVEPTIKAVVRGMAKEGYDTTTSHVEAIRRFAAHYHLTPKTHGEE